MEHGCRAPLAASGLLGRRRLRLPWHPRLSERLGLHRLVECPGSHELCFTDPALLARKIIEAGRD